MASSPAAEHQSSSKLTHLNSSGSIHMVSISSKEPTDRTATAVCAVYFSNGDALPLIRENRLKKGDVLGVARMAGIMAAKKTSDLIVLCHPIAITQVGIEFDVLNGVDLDETLTKITNMSPSTEVSESGNFGSIKITATVSCHGRTGVEMEALTAAFVAALNIYDMCKSVDKGMRIEGLRVTRKEGGQSGTWIEGRQSDERSPK